MGGLFEELIGSVDPVRVMQRVAEQSCLLIPAAEGATVSLRDHSGCFVVLAAHGAVASELGRVAPIRGTLMSHLLETRRPVMCSDLTTDPRVTRDTLADSRRLGVGSSMSIPLLRDEVAIGVLTVTASRAHGFDEHDAAQMTSMSGLISAMISTNAELTHLVRTLLDEPDMQTGSSPRARFLASLVDPDAAERDRWHADVDEALAPGVLRTVFQPVVALADRRVHGFESLSRFPDRRSRGPDHWFAGAHQVGRGVELESCAVRTALAAADAIPTEYVVGVNLSPVAALDPTIQAMLCDADRDLVVELTEHEPAPALTGPGLEPLRGKKMRLAVDDAGAGFASLTSILRLRPDMLKLDRELTAGIDTDPVRRALATSLVAFARELGALTVAEGIETEAQFDVLRELGIQYGQGFWLGRPLPVEDAVRELRERRPDGPWI